MKVVFTMPIPAHLKQAQQEKFPEIEAFYTEDLAQFEKLAEMDTIVSYGGGLTDEIISSAKRLTWLMIFSAGVDNLPKEAILNRSITVSNVRGIHAVPMAEYVFGYLLDHVKQLSYFAEKSREREWHSTHPVSELAGKKLLIAGTGAIGQKVAQIGRAFDMQTIGINTSGHESPNFEKVYNLKEGIQKVAEADFFVSVLPNTKQTYHIYDQAFFEAANRSAVFVNIGRGPAVSLETLVEAARSKKMAHFYLDVLEQEPLPANHPLWEQENVTITPHVSGHSERYLDRSFAIWFASLEQMRQNLPIVNKVDLHRGY
ncbi:NAD(P)-dependent oxidoreductase [Listeria costaricensis]|uniref:NAD(P)-dependent oxidoreductase n=1 Tax=Listeria costaricensis TaxID=2026604 RepID=UPI000C07585D|nr:NAD(P)-dependent oxidoreductase [Listeria costaricensis]